MKPSELLRGAKKHLWDGNGEWIRPTMVCTALHHALHTVWDKHGGTSQTYKDAEKSYRLLLDYIGVALAGRPSALEWLHDVAKVNLNGCKPRDFQIYRRRWVDHMIKEFKRSGQ